MEDKLAFLLTPVYDAFPEPVHGLVHKEPRANYKELATLVHRLDTKDLKEAAKRYACDEETVQLAHLQSSPTKALCDALFTMHLQMPQKQYPVPQLNAYMTAPQPNLFSTKGGHGNLFVVGYQSALPWFRTGNQSWCAGQPSDSFSMNATQ